jgi:hypothetical protein
MNNNLIKTIGVIASVVGIGSNLVINWVGEKKMDEKIEKKIIDILAKNIG